MRRQEIPKARLWQSVWRARSDSLQNWRWPPSTLRTLLPACRRVEMDEWVVEMSYSTGVDEKAWVARGRSCRQIVSVSLITNELARDVAPPLEVGFTCQFNLTRLTGSIYGSSSFHNIATFSDDFSTLRLRHTAHQSRVPRSWRWTPLMQRWQTPETRIPRLQQSLLPVLSTFRSFS